MQVVQKVADDQTRLERFLDHAKELAARAAGLLKLALLLNGLAAVLGFLVLTRVWGWHWLVASIALLLALMPGLLLILYRLVFAAVLELPKDLGETATELLQALRKEDVLESGKKPKVSALTQVRAGFKHYRNFARLIDTAKQLSRTKNIVSALSQIRYAGVLMNPLFWLGFVVLLAISFMLSPLVIGSSLWLLF